MHPSAPHTLAALMADATGLGRVRIMLRGEGGFAEVFCPASALRLAGGWLHLHRPGAHLHVPVAALTGASLHEAGGEAHPARPSLWLHDRSGVPLLLLFLDQADGSEWTSQEACFRALRARWGAHVPFTPREVEPEVEPHVEPAERVLH